MLHIDAGNNTIQASSQQHVSLFSHACAIVCVCLQRGKRQRGQPGFANSVYAGQENRPLAALKKGAVHMHPFTLLWLIRLTLYIQAEQKGDWLWRTRHRYQPCQEDMIANCRNPMYTRIVFAHLRVSPTREPCISVLRQSCPSRHWSMWPHVAPEVAVAPKTCWLQTQPFWPQLLHL
jgi:hypothetical protein